jgi:hypothetical protein
MNSPAITALNLHEVGPVLEVSCGFNNQAGNSMKLRRHSNTKGGR